MFIRYLLVYAKTVLSFGLKEDAPHAPFILPYASILKADGSVFRVAARILKHRISKAYDQN